MNSLAGSNFKIKGSVPFSEAYPLFSKKSEQNSDLACPRYEHPLDQIRSHFLDIGSQPWRPSSGWIQFPSTVDFFGTSLGPYGQKETAKGDNQRSHEHFNHGIPPRGGDGARLP